MTNLIEQIKKNRNIIKDIFIQIFSKDFQIEDFNEPIIPVNGELIDRIIYEMDLESIEFLFNNMDNIDILDDESGKNIKKHFLNCIDGVNYKSKRKWILGKTENIQKMVNENNLLIKKIYMIVLGLFPKK